MADYPTTSLDCSEHSYTPVQVSQNSLDYPWYILGWYTAVNSHIPVQVSKIHTYWLPQAKSFFLTVYLYRMMIRGYSLSLPMRNLLSKSFVRFVIAKYMLYFK